MVWTYSYPIPIDCSDSDEDYSHICCKSIESNIYIFANIGFEVVDRMDVFVFYTKTRQLQSINYKVPEGFGDTLEHIETDGENIYMWRSYNDSLETMLFKFDVITKSITYILSIDAEQISDEFPVIGERMYGLIYEDEGPTYLITIDLSRMKVISKMRWEIDATNFTQSLDRVDGQLYILNQSIDNTERNIYTVINGQLLLLSQDTFAEKDELIVVSDWNNGRIVYERTIDQTYHSDTFDFKTLTWNRKIAEEPGFCVDENRISDVERVDGVRYVILRRLGTDFAEYDLRVFDKLSNLSTMCYLNIVEEVVKNNKYEELENVKSQLHPLMSYELDELIGWRKEEKELLTAENALKVTQMKAMIEEIMLMEWERIIEADIVQAFYELFDSWLFFFN